jgi:hypothetical protein
LFSAVWASTAAADFAIILKNDFIEQNKNRATLEATYHVDHTHHRAKAPKDDGDIHCAGTAPEIGLATVAEVMNAKGEPAAVQAIVAAEGSSPLHLTGVWRVWPEHAGGGEDFEQGSAVDPIVNTNPPHVFELHPLTTVEGIDVRDSFHPITGYTYKTDSEAFSRFENQACEIQPGHETTSIVTGQIGYNYVKFTLQLLEDPTHELDDGSLSVFATVLSRREEEPLVGKLRCIFVKGTAPEARVRKLHAGDELRVVGIPRISLALVSFRAHHASDRPSLLTRTLPYEIVICAVLPKR